MRKDMTRSKLSLLVLLATLAIAKELYINIRMVDDSDEPVMVYKDGVLSDKFNKESG